MTNDTHINNIHINTHQSVRNVNSNMFYVPSELERGRCYCEVSNLVHDVETGFEVCTTCGVVVDSILDESPEYQYDDRGHDIGYHGQQGASLGTVMDTNNKLTKRLEASLADTSDMILYEIKNVAEQVCLAIHIRVPHIIHDTAVEIASIHRERIYLSGRKKIASIAMAVYFACKLHGADREIRLFSTSCCIDMKLLNFAIKSIKEHLKDTKYIIISNSENKYHALITQFTERLNISTENIKKLRRNSNIMLDNISDIFDTGKKPRTIVASIICICALTNDMNLDLKEISRATNVCSQSISKCISYMKNKYNIDF
ncbi:hypothetical protein PBCVNY2B_171L [Paramecium bursaria Chlorella virus NY2B]|uniref:Transcription factor TFIIB cyclin-like domain-containing protein n=1 Tax=Paramecium bursaria Chlorella virus NYs1 TaxID=83442 RepID=M1HH65_9PHYC|nr:hypothetical protein AR158_C142L [Paramecium bursaria Chlorella virus AR158]YP_009665263.1 hypothetical protein FK949_gp053 [Paramecium bursaria Chlorella virus NYs1]AGE54108.1 hypothetical protein PBCVIL52s1_117R [Paramecium bursaria Chlorella virus IL-5-2s1]AGE54936.1 hypothetical protein PBCVMA1D_468R [Paramecium bursaria Chlorella virus MA1D]AGE58246.1 hypothetical protein PBCVNY2B_171L [Paramecium bursaria Chlorella virus NY2B]ABU43688.1 hypothetical protein AR158_C142L [Paramecium bur